MTERCLRRLLAVLCYLLIGLVLYTMYGLSAQPADVSNALSSRVTSLIARIINPEFMNMSRLQQLFIIQYLHAFVRELAHFAQFVLLGALFMCAALCHMWSLTPRILLALVGSVLCAAADECHQLFVSGRSAELRDVAIDFTGAVLGVLLILALRGLILASYRAQKIQQNPAKD